MGIERKGATSYDAIVPDLLSALNRGELSCATHVEQMAVDMNILAVSLFGPLPSDIDLRERSFIARMRAGGRLVWGLFGEELWRVAPSWSSDVARCWAAMAVGCAESNLPRALELARPFAADDHFGVREFAWLGVRGLIREQTIPALKLLEDWSIDDNPRCRRFAVEATRPISVWGVHLPLLKASPEMALPLIQQYRCEPEAYPARAARNWLRDARRSDPAWVDHVVRQWTESCGCEATLRVCRRLTQASVTTP